MITLVFNIALVLFGAWYLYRAHMQKMKWKQELHELQSLDHSWSLFSEGLGIAIVSRMDAIIKHTDIRTKHTENSPYYHVIASEELVGQLVWSINPESGYVKIRESGVPGDNANRIEVYRKPGHRPLLIACYFKNSLKWCATTEDLPYQVVKQHNLFLDNLLDVWSKYCTEQLFLTTLASATMASIGRAIERKHSRG